MNKKNDEEQFIFNRMAEGDKEAFRFFFEKYYSDLCNLVNIYIHNQFISEELVQDIYVYFWEKREKINIETSVKSYLFRASKNRCLNYLRNEKTKLNIHTKLSKDRDTTYELPENYIDAEKLEILIKNAVDTLPERCRNIYNLSREKELSYKEISNELKISVKTVENQMSIALKRLREFLRPYYDDIFILLIIMVINQP